MHKSVTPTRKKRSFRSVPLLAGLITAGLVGIGTSATSLADSRIEIEIPKAEREHCESRMREYLETTNEILWATLEGDMTKVADTAIQAVPPRYLQDSLAGQNDQSPSRRFGRGYQQGGENRRSGEGRRGGGGGGGSQHERMARFMPEAYQEMMQSMHSNLQQLAKDARAQAETSAIQRRLGEIQDTCVACHATYKFTTIEAQR